MNPFFKIDAVTTTAAGLKGRAKYTYNHAATAITEDSTPAMLHAFAALTDGAKAIVLQSGKYSNLYIRGERKGMTAEEAAKGVTLSLDTLAKSYAMMAIIRESIKTVKRTSYDPFSANADDRRASALYLANIYIGEL